MLTLRQKRFVQLILIILFAGAVKYYYSSASVNDLNWILAPTTAAVEIVTGSQFEFESYSGYMKSDKTFLIAASCSGMNFLITSFLVLIIGRFWRKPFCCLSLRFAVLAAGIAFLTTIAANTVRISSALSNQRHHSENPWLTFEQLHRIEGTAIYFGFLLLISFASGLFGSEQTAATKRGFGTLQSYLIPLFVYYAITLAVPFLNGAYLNGRLFWEHFFFVFITPLFVLAPFLVIEMVKARRLTKKPILPNNFGR